jgi:ABC-2 type transport system ATP-binding protein
MSGLDPIGRALVKDIILELKKQGKTVFFSTHVTSDVELICDRVGILVNGELQAVKPVREVLDEGVVGYWLKLPDTSKPSADLLASCAVVLEKGRYVVSRKQLTPLLTGLLQAGIEPELIEPDRRDLEAYFLAVVKGKTFS